MSKKVIKQILSINKWLWVLSNHVQKIDSDKLWSAVNSFRESCS